MNQTKMTLLALAVASGGLSATRAVAQTLVPYTLSATFTNSQAIWDVNGGPVSVNGFFPQVGAGVNVQTDGAGKITGGGVVTIVYNSGGLPFSRFAVKVTGKISSTKTKPTPQVSMMLVGSGYTADGNGAAALNNNIVLAFTGTPGTDPNNPTRQTIVGSVAGKISGLTPLGTNAKFTVAATAGSSSFQMDFRRGRPDFDALDVVQSESKQVLLNNSLMGKGTVLSNAIFNASIKGINTGKGNTFSLTGTLGLYTNNIGAVPVTFYAPVAMTLNGRCEGQIISGDATTVGAALIH